MKRHTILTVLIVLIVFIFIPIHKVYAADDENWGYVGNAGFSASTAYSCSLELDSNNIPYVAYSDSSQGYKATVMKYNGLSWVNVGNPGFSAGSVSDLSFALDSNNTPYVAYKDSGNDDKATVMKYDGSNWVNVGSAGFSAAKATDTSLAFDSNNTPYIAYQDKGNSYKATVMKYNGLDWVNVGSAGFSDSGILYTSLALDSNNTPYVAYKDYGNYEKATVMKYNGSDWVNVGSAGFSVGSPQYISLKFDSNNTPFVAYRDIGNDNKAIIMKYDGLKWISVNNNPPRSNDLYENSLAIDSGNTPYLVYQDIDNSSKASVIKIKANISPSNISIDNNLISENQSIDTLIGTLTTEDVNNYDTHTYLLVEGDGDVDNSSFTIDGNELKSAEIFDYETKSSYSIRVKTTDSGGLSFERTFNIYVQDAETTFTLTFDSQSGSPVSDQTVSDGDYITKPSDPTKSGYAFDGWYTDSICSENKRWDFDNNRVKSDTTLYAKWIDFTSVTDIMLDNPYKVLRLGVTVNIDSVCSYSIYPSNATDKSVIFSSSNTNVATISSGMITAHSEGRTVITITANDHSNRTVEAKMMVEVMDSSTSGVSANNTSIIGNVVDINGSKLSNILVTIYSEPLDTLIGNESGAFVYNSIPYTNHTLILSNDNGHEIGRFNLDFHNTGSQNINVNNTNNTANISFSNDTNLIDLSIRVNDTFSDINIIDSNIKATHFITNPKTGYTDDGM